MLLCEVGQVVYSMCVSCKTGMIRIVSTYLSHRVVKRIE